MAGIVEPDVQDVERSPCDVLRLVVGGVLLAVLLVVEAWFGDTVTTFLSDLLSGLQAVPQWLLEGAAAVVRVGGALLLAGGLAVTVVRGRWRFLLTVGVAAAFAVVIVAVLDAMHPATAPPAMEGIVAPGFPTVYGLAAVVAVLTAAAPWLSRSSRQLASALALGLVAVRFLSAPMSLVTFAAALAGWLAGSATLVALGGPRRRPTAHAVADGLADVGVHLQDLVPASVDARGSTPYLATDSDGQRLFVKALGDDERSADLLFRLWRRVRSRAFGDEPSYRTLRRTVEHEALVSLVAHNVGIRTPRFIALATAEPNGVVLSYEAIAGASIDRVDPTAMDDLLLAAVWTKVIELRRYGIAHRDLRLANVFRADDGEIWLIDFGFSELAASDLLLTTDLAELMASTATKVGAERAYRAAEQAVGADALRPTLARLKPLFLSGATRTALKADPAVLADLRRLVSASP